MQKSDISENKDYEPAFSAIVRVDNIPSKGRRLKFELDKTQLKNLAEQLQIDDLFSLKVRLLIMQIKGGLQVSGQMEANIEQKCVVSFKPVQQMIVENLDRVFLHGKPNNADVAGSESFVDMEGDDDLPDYYYGSEIDFVEFITEVLVLAIDPFPRLAGEKIEISQTEPQSSPFDVLTNLKQQILK